MAIENTEKKQERKRKIHRIRKKNTTEDDRSSRLRAESLLTEEPRLAIRERFLKIRRELREFRRELKERVGVAK